MLKYVRWRATTFTALECGTTCKLIPFGIAPIHRLYEAVMNRDRTMSIGNHVDTDQLEISIAISRRLRSEFSCRPVSRSCLNGMVRMMIYGYVMIPSTKQLPHHNGLTDISQRAAWTIMTTSSRRTLPPFIITSTSPGRNNFFEGSPFPTSN